MPIRTSAGTVATYTPEMLHTSSTAGTPLSRGVSAGLVLGVARNLGRRAEGPADRVKRSSPNLNVDLDVVLCVPKRSPRPSACACPATTTAATPDTLQRRFLDTPGEIVNEGDTVTGRIKRRAYSPVLHGADLPAETAVPWWGGHPLRFDFV